MGAGGVNVPALLEGGDVWGGVEGWGRTLFKLESDCEHSRMYVYKKRSNNLTRFGETRASDHDE